MNGWVLAVAVILVLGIMALATHLVLTWFERRGWVYYRTPDKPRPRSLGILEEIYQPSVSHVTEQEIILDTVADQSESGDPETPNEPT
jgi:hypothetical protein